MTYDQWKNDYPIYDGPDDDSNWESLAEQLECIEAKNAEEADALFRASEAIRKLIDCPCGGWDCTAAPGGPMYGCPHERKTT